jgi:hypothetical protein
MLLPQLGAIMLGPGSLVKNSCGDVTVQGDATMQRRRTNLSASWPLQAYVLRLVTRLEPSAAIERLVTETLIYDGHYRWTGIAR